MTRSPGRPPVWASALVVLLLAGCARVVPGAAAPDPVVLAEIARCDAAVDAAVDSTVASLMDVETRYLFAEPFDSGPVDEVPRVCTLDPARSYSEFLVDTSQTYAPGSLVGQVLLEVFQAEFCGNSSPYPLDELTAAAQDVCGVI